MNFNYEKNEIYLLNETGKRIAEITFPEIAPGVVNINHTFVDPSLRGQGIASRLVEEAIQLLRNQRKKARITCPYVVKWFAEHQGYEDVLA